MKKLLSYIFAITLFSFTAYSGSIKVAWDPNPESDVVSYLVFADRDPLTNENRSSAEVIVTVNLSESPQATFQLVPGTWNIGVIAVNTLGLQSDLSEQLNVVMPSAPVNFKVVVE